MVEVVVDSVRVNLQSYQRVVMLKDKTTDRLLPIWIGNAEADAIVMGLQKLEIPRPLTHDLIKAILSEIGARVSHVVVSDLSNDVFYARINVEFGGRHHEIDARPSDAIAVAIRLQVPIYVDESVLDKASVELEQETEEGASSETGASSEGKTEAQPEHIPNAFRDFINTLDLDDLGRGEKGKR
ncbi:MAG: bifunctional nuclease family protein [Chloroflexota bacterium]|nr:MAG: bifunctional nuclease family protein [Chloroflexota bacterium]